MDNKCTIYIFKIQFGCICCLTPDFLSVQLSLQTWLQGLKYEYILYISVFFPFDTLDLPGIFQKITLDIRKDIMAFSEKLPVKKASFTD